MQSWWKLDIPVVAAALRTDVAAGLAAGEAAARFTAHGPNQLTEKERVRAAEIFLDQFRDFIVWVLIGAALVSGFLGEWVDAVAIIVIVILNAILGFIQEYRAEQSLAALKKLSAPVSKVIRGGNFANVPSAALVPGDLVELDAGDLVPADGRLVSVTPAFATLEASLTGESNPVLKTSLTLVEDDVPLADRANMVYLGTSVSSGKGRLLVTETGMATELGRIAGMIQEIGREATPLQKKLEEFGRWIVYLAFVLVALVFLTGLLRGEPALDLFLTSVSLAVAAIPEGLPAVVTIALALGVQRMVRRHALIRKLPSVETLGAATVICSDKTGTLTKNEMTVQVIYAGDRFFGVTGTGYDPAGKFFLDGNPVAASGHPDLLASLRCGLLCNGSRLIHEKGAWRIGGDPTEGALLVAAAKAGLDREALERDHPFVEEIPFDSERKKMTIVRTGNGRFTAFVKGAPDVLLTDCTRIDDRGTVRPITEEDRTKILAANTGLANKALRVLAVAYRPLEREPAEYSAVLLERELVFAGLVAMIDPPREEVRRAIAACATAGIRTVMITGDHKNTATAIARELGFFGEDKRALTGEELERMSDDELFAAVESVAVYARVAPEHKLRIVRAWRRHGQVVAMTGDGVNDAPAVKEADIGVAMGITGTDVTKEVADMVVTDDNFASIVAAVEEGRGIYDNIRKFITYLLSCNAGEILVMFIASLAGLPLPLLAIHILWMNLVTDGLPALALGVEPVEKDVMRRPPRPVHEAVVTKQRVAVLLMQGSFLAACTLAAFVLALRGAGADLGFARTTAFIVLALSQLFHSFSSRSYDRSIFSIGFFSNSKLVAAVLISFALQMMVVYVPVFQGIFKTVPLGPGELLQAVLIASFPLWAMELVKLVGGLRSRRRGRQEQ